MMETDVDGVVEIETEIWTETPRKFQTEAEPETRYIRDRKRASESVREVDTCTGVYRDTNKQSIDTETARNRVTDAEPDRDRIRQRLRETRTDAKPLANLYHRGMSRNHANFSQLSSRLPQQILFRIRERRRGSVVGKHRLTSATVGKQSALYDVQRGNTILFS